MTRGKFHERAPDPGAGGFVARVNDLDGMMKTFRAQHIHIESKGHAPVWLTTTSYNVFIEDPNGMNVELLQLIPLDQQKQGEHGAHP